MRTRLEVLVAVAVLVAGCSRSSKDAASRVASARDALPSAPTANLFTRSAEQVELGSNFAIIPFEAWQAAVDGYPNDLGGLQRPELMPDAVSAAALSNDLWADGAIGSSISEELMFSKNDILIVATDAQVYDDGVDRRVIASKFFIAAVGLEGSTPWLARNVSIAINPIAEASGGRCCGPVGSGEQKWPPLDPGDPLPGCSHGPIAYCDFGRLRTASQYGQDNRRVQYGREPISLKMYSAHGELATLFFDAPLGGVGSAMCTQVLPACIQQGDLGLDPFAPWEADIPHGNACAGTTSVSGRPVPPRCEVASSSTFGFHSGAGTGFHVTRPSGGAIAPAECDGRCPGCSTVGAVVNTDYVPRQCWLRESSGADDICGNNRANDLMRQLQNTIQASISNQTLSSCGDFQDPTAKCGACEPVSGELGAFGAQECARCSTPLASGGYTNCTYYPTRISGSGLVYSDTAGPPAEPSIGQGSAPTATLDDISLFPDVPCTGIGCGSSGRVLNRMPSAAPRPGGTAEGPEDPPLGLNATDPSNGQGNNAANNAQQTAKNNEAKDGDPVSLFDGSLSLTTTDLSLPGAQRPLEFTRFYNSRSNTRGMLGSNWSHSYEVRLVPLRRQNLPSWVDPYCAGTPFLTTCVMLIAGDSSRLFYLDQAKGLFMPQAGSMATIRTVPGGVTDDDRGWVLRQPDGHLQFFDRLGYLTRDQDRFGNGVTLEYQPTAAGQLAEAVCPRVQYALANGAYAALTGPTGIGVEQDQCVLLYGLTGFANMPQYDSDTWAGNSAAFPLPPNPDPSLVQARAQLLAEQLHFGTPAPFGPAHKRLTTVIDDHDRRLGFQYFDSGTNAGLLRKVVGPAGVAVEFNYAAPPGMPEGLNERFLVSAKRTDTTSTAPGVVAAGGRGYEFEYAWQRATEQMPSDLTQAGLNYLAFFNNIYNCSSLVRDACGAMHSSVLFGDTARMVAEQTRRLFSEAADNITTVRVKNDNTSQTRIESETRYARDVYAKDFDRVLFQRWGSTPDAALPPVAAPTVQPGITWQTSFPIASFQYQGAAPIEAGGTYDGDETEAFLPAALRSRYVLEETNAVSLQSSYAKGLLLAPNAASGLPPGASLPFLVVGTPDVLENTVREACGIDKLPKLRTALPGYKRSLDYFDLTLPTTDLATPGVAWEQPLKRSRVSCETLAMAETYDVRHNDLATTWHAEPLPADGGTAFVYETLIGRRKFTASNANRICQWVRYVDRDGDQHYSGLNFQGRPLVDAVRVVENAQEKWKVAETLYNADGNVLSQRRTTDTPWAPTAGDTRYSYHEEPTAPGKVGSREPRYWARRGNVIRVWARPRGGSVQDEVETTNTQVASLGRYTAYGYEPFFNQVRLVESGNVKSDGSSEILGLTSVVFDYQEYAATSPEFVNLLLGAQEWGAGLAQGSTGAFDLDPPSGRQLRFELFDTELNGDGAKERPGRAHPRAAPQQLRRGSERRHLPELGAERPAVPDPEPRQVGCGLALLRPPRPAHGPGRQPCERDRQARQRRLPGLRHPQPAELGFNLRAPAPVLRGLAAAVPVPARRLRQRGRPTRRAGPQPGRHRRGAERSRRGHHELQLQPTGARQRCEGPLGRAPRDGDRHRRPPAALRALRAGEQHRARLRARVLRQLHAPGAHQPVLRHGGEPRRVAAHVRQRRPGALGVPRGSGRRLRHGPARQRHPALGVHA